ncbi:MAG: DUF3488 domain-containing protein [Candidatus Dadabacteria bacterium]|nr:MAG: DUF3488 domain-containing protein [Candidatus Dadabacteria bacterium]
MRPGYRAFLLWTVYGIMFAGWGAVWIADRIEPLLMVVLLLAMVAGLYCDVRGRHVVRTSWNRLLLLTGLGLAIADWKFWSGSWFLAVVFLLLYVGTVRALAPKANRDLQQMIGLGFLQLLAASVLTVDLGYAFFFLLFFILAPWALFAVAVKAEFEGEPDMLRGAVAVEGPIEAPAGAERLLSRPLLSAMLVAIAMTMIVTAVFFAAFPRLSTGVFGGRLGSTRAVAGLSERVDLGGFGDVLSDSSPAARLVFERGRLPVEQLYLRATVLTSFDGTSWTAPDRGRVMAAPNGHLGLAAGVEPGEPIVRTRIVTEDLGTTIMPLPQRAVRVASPALRYQVNDQFGVVRTPGYQGGLRYHVDVAPQRYWRSINWNVPRPDRLPAEVVRYTELPDRTQLPDEIWRYADRTDLGWVDEALLAFQTDFDYTVELPGDVEPLQVFFKRRAGHCELFATALALMLRAAGVPAVVVNGFRGGEDMGDYVLIRQRNAHSWVEAWHPRLGWVPLDPTPPAPVPSGWLNRAQERWQEFADAVWFFWMDRIVAYDLATQADMVRGAQRGARQSGQVLRQLGGRFREWMRQGGAWLALGVGVLFAVALLWWFRPRRRNGRNRGATETPSWWLRLLRELERSGVVRPSYEPVDAWFRRTSSDPQTADLLRDYQRWRFGGVGDVAELRARAKAQRRQLRAMRRSR